MFSKLWSVATVASNGVANTSAASRWTSSTNEFNECIRMLYAPPHPTAPHPNERWATPPWSLCPEKSLPDSGRLWEATGAMSHHVESVWFVLISTHIDASIVQMTWDNSKSDRYCGKCVAKNCEIWIERACLGLVVHATLCWRFCFKKSIQDLGFTDTDFGQLYDESKVMFMQPALEWPGQPVRRYRFKL